VGAADAKRPRMGRYRMVRRRRPFERQVKNRSRSAAEEHSRRTAALTILSALLSLGMPSNTRIGGGECQGPDTVVVAHSVFLDLKRTPVSLMRLSHGFGCYAAPQPTVISSGVDGTGYRVVPRRRWRCRSGATCRL
jgi:hypothetical protein